MILNKLYAALGLLAVLGLGYARYVYVVNDRDALKTQNTQLVSDLQNQTAINAKKEIDIAAANGREQKQIAANEAIKNEIKDYRACVDAGECGVQFRFKACPVTGSDPFASQPPASEAASTDRRDFESWYFDLLGAVRDNAQQIKGLQEDLAIRSDPNYCKFK